MNAAIEEKKDEAARKKAHREAARQSKQQKAGSTRPARTAAAMQPAVAVGNTAGNVASQGTLVSLKCIAQITSKHNSHLLLQTKGLLWMVDVAANDLGRTT